MRRRPGRVCDGHGLTPCATRRDESRDGHEPRRWRTVVTHASPRVARARLASPACSPASPRSPSRASAATRSPWRWTCAAGCPRSRSSGLPDRAVRESRERVRAAVQNSGLEFPHEAPHREPRARARAQGRPGLRPRDRGGRCSRRAARCRPRRSSGTRASAASSRSAASCGRSAARWRPRWGRGRRGCERLIVPPENAAEAALVDGPRGDRRADAGADRATSCTALESPSRPRRRRRRAAPARGGPDLADVRGQEDAKRALEIAAAGGHNLLMVGPAGRGQDDARAPAAGILPPPDARRGARDHRRSTAPPGSASGALARERPFRAPHHTISAQGLVGGGAVPRPGEITLAHRGVLFLDELAGVRAGRARRAAPAARGGPGRDHARPAHARVPAPTRCSWRRATAARAARSADRCRCAAGERDRYLRRLSGPLLDRSTSSARSQPVPPVELVGAAEAAVERRAVRERVAAARERQLRAARGNRGALQRRHGRPPHATARAAGRRRAARPARRARAVGDLSGRGHDRVLRVARTIADLAGREQVAPRDIEEALSLPARRLGAAGRMSRRGRHRRLRPLPAAIAAHRPPGAADHRAARTAGRPRAPGCSRCPTRT